jgi:hypothetical protein
MARPALQLAADFRLAFEEIPLRTLGADLRAFLIVLEPLRIVARVIKAAMRFIDPLQMLFRVRFTMVFELPRRV